MASLYLSLSSPALAARGGLLLQYAFLCSSERTRSLASKNFVSDLSIYTAHRLETTAVIEIVNRKYRVFLPDNINQTKFFARRPEPQRRVKHAASKHVVIDKAQKCRL